MINATLLYMMMLIIKKSKNKKNINAKVCFLIYTKNPSSMYIFFFKYKRNYFIINQDTFLLFMFYELKFHLEIKLNNCFQKMRKLRATEALQFF